MGRGSGNGGVVVVAGAVVGMWWPVMGLWLPVCCVVGRL